MADIGALLGAAGIGGAIGQAIVRLELDTSKYSAEMKAAEGQTVASANAMGTSTSKFAGLAQSALLGVGVAAVAGAALSVKAAIEANDAHLKLQNTFENNERLSDSSVAAFERQADALRDLTGVDDEAIIRAQALLGQFKLTGTQVEQLIPAIVDLSAKMGIDLEAAAKAVGKATQGSAGILSRYGIILDEDALKADAFGTTLKGLGVAQGFAAARADAEPWRVLGAKLEEVAEDIGNALLPVLQDLADFLSDVLVPVLATVADGIELAFSSSTYTDIPIIGEIFKGLGDVIQHVGFALDTSHTQTELNAMATEQMGGVVAQTEKECREYAKALAAANKETGENAKRTEHLSQKFKDLHFDLEDVADSTRVSRDEFITYFRTLARNADDLKHAAHELHDEKWLDPDFVDFLSTKGPQWIITFADTSERQQKRLQEQWEESNQKTHNANVNLDTLRTTLDKLDSGTSKHTVQIQYEYVGFDPSKPGMSPQQR